MYTLQYKKSVEKDLRKLPMGVRKIIVQKIKALANAPRPDGASKLRGSDSTYRIRYADYRVIYQIDDAVLTILVIKAGHRREVYREL